MRRAFGRRFVQYYVILIAATALILIVYYETEHEFLLHLAAIPIEILVATFIVERLLRAHEEQRSRRRIMAEAATAFHSQIETVVQVGIRTAQPPDARVPKLETLSVEELKRLRARAGPVKFTSAEEVDAAVNELVDAEDLWLSIMSQAIEHDIDETFVNMMRLLDFVHHVKAFRRAHPGEDFGRHALGDEAATKRMEDAGGSAVVRYLDLLIEFKEKEPDMLQKLRLD